MMKRTALALFLAAGIALPALFSPSLSWAEDKKKDSPWLHIEVIEDDGDGANVKVNLPLSLAQIALEMASKMEGEVMIDGGHLQIENCDISVRDMRRLWAELKDAGDADFVTVEEDDERVEIFRRGDSVFINVDSTDGREKVRMELPVSLVDALLSGDEESLNIAAAITELQAARPGDIITVQDGRDYVRIWID